MTRTLVRKLFRDLALNLIVVMLLLFFFQLLWAKVTQRVSAELLEAFAQIKVDEETLRGILFQGPGQLIQTLMGGDTISFHKAEDMMSVSYVHPLTQMILCIWAIGRAAGAIAGEIDRGTMELLLAQPLRRRQILLAHLLVDLGCILLLCLAMWLGTLFGVYLNDLLEPTRANLRVDPGHFLPGLLSVATLMLAVGGVTLAISASGRQRSRVLGLAVFVTLLQFLLNLIGQLWPPLEPFRPFTVFYYYQPQPLILNATWYQRHEVWQQLAILLAVGTAGYSFAFWRFCTRDIPAPL